MADLITISSSAFGAHTHVVAFRAREALGSPYELEIFLTIPLDEELDPAEASGARATLSVERGKLPTETPFEEKPMHWSGILLEVSILAEIGQRSLVRAVLVPRLYRAAQNHHSRIFTGKSVVDIVTEVLEGNGLRGDAFDASGLGSGYPKEEHIAQWRESDLDFLHRWFEREGIYYYFEQDGEAEKLVLVDKNPAPEAIPARYHPVQGSDATAGPCITRFRADARSLVGVVKVVDRDYGNPSLPMSKEGQVSDFAGEYVLAHERLVRSDDVDRIAKVRGEAMRRDANLYKAEATKLGMVPGAIFHLDEHPRAGFAKDYLVTEAEHVGWNEASSGDIADLIGLDPPSGTSSLYQVRVGAQLSATPFRLPKRTPWPRIDGFETATVDGPAESDYAQIDDMGRYQVRFHADESMGEDAKVSTWVRMMQPHAGAPEGMHFPLRKGTEVIVAFLGGDPDRPVILGAVPNAVTPSVVTKKNHTQNRLFTGGGTTLEIEDEAGGQYAHWYTPVDHTHFHMGAPRTVQGKGAPEHATKASLGWSTEGNAVLSVGKEWDVGVGAKLHEIVKGDVVEDYEKDHKLTVTQKQTYVIKQGKDDTITKGWKQKIEGGWNQTEITGGWTQTKIDGGWTQTAISGGWTQSKITGGWKQPSISGGWKQDLTGDWDQKIKGDWILKHTGAINHTITGSETRTVTEAVTWTFAAGITLTSPSMSTVDASWSQVNGDGVDSKLVNKAMYGFDITLKGLELNSKQVEINGKLMELNDKLAEITIGILSVSLRSFELSMRQVDLSSGSFALRLKSMFAFL